MLLAMSAETSHVGTGLGLESLWSGLPLRLRGAGGDLRDERRPEKVGGAAILAPIDTQRRKAAGILMAAELGESWQQIDSIVSDYICDVLAEADESEVRDASSFVHSIASVISSYGCTSNGRIQNVTQTTTASTQQVVKQVLSKLGNMSAGAWQAHNSSQLAPDASVLGESGGILKSLNMASLLEWGGQAEKGSTKYVRLGVLLEEAEARARVVLETDNAQQNPKKTVAGNVNSDIDRADEADERKRRLNKPSGGYYAAPPTVSFLAGGKGESGGGGAGGGGGGGRDLCADGIDLSYGGSVLLEGASLRVAYARRYGVAGRNGVGIISLACAYCYISSVRILASSYCYIHMSAYYIREEHSPARQEC